MEWPDSCSPYARARVLYFIIIIITIAFGSVHRASTLLWRFLKNTLEKSEVLQLLPPEKARAKPLVAKMGCSALQSCLRSWVLLRTRARFDRRYRYAITTIASTFRTFKKCLVHTKHFERMYVCVCVFRANRPRRVV